MPLWKQHPRYPEYEVSDDGQVRKTVIRGRPSNRILEGRKRRYGHVEVCLWDGRRHYEWVHILVLETFVGPRPEGMIARHKNGEANDNRLDNLIWGTYLENARDRAEHGKTVTGVRSPHSALTEEQVLEILNSTESRKSLAHKYNVSVVAIWKIKTGRTYKDIFAKVSFPS